jgi:hypothetical protein
MAKFLGGSLQPEVSAQLTARSNYLKSDKYTNGISALHGNTPFINLYSSVSGTGRPDTFSKLEGGLAFQADTVSGNPVGYSNYVGADQRSFTPRPGIVDAKVKTKGTFGALRDVEITVKAFNVADLDAIYDLFCRPGFSFLLEWGHSIYIDSKGGQSTMQHRAAAEKFTAGAKYDDIMEAIRTGRTSTSYNYDAIVAICKNFSWSFNSDGSYDINLSLISKGEVIESIKTSFDPNIIEKNAGNLTAGFNDKSERKSLLHFFCKRLELSQADGELKGAALISALSGAGKAPGLAALLKAEDCYAATAPGFDIKSPTSFFDDKTTFIYISLRTILAVFNTTIMWVGNDQRAIKFKTQPGKTGFNGYFTHDDHHSINPFVCVTPNLNSKNAFWESKPAGKALHPGITNARQNKEDILDICVSNLYLYEKLDAIYDDDQAKENEPGILDVMKAILGGVGEALGGVNEFDLDYDEDTDEWAIVDRKCKIKGAALDSVEPLDLIGLGSFAYDIKTESKITNKLASQVSIAAQAGGTGTKQNVAEMLQWNRGHYDKIFPRKNEGATQAPQGASDEAEKEADAKAEWNDRCKEAFDKFNGTGLFTDQQYDPDLFKGIQSGHQKYQSQLVPMVCSEENLPAPGTIPVELSFTIHGVAGFRIGEVFKLSANSMKVLPQAYSGGRIGFIITRVDHSIDEGGWKTEVGALMYNLQKLTGGSSARGKFGKSGGTAQPLPPPAPKDDSVVDPNATDKLQNQTALGTNVSYDAVKAAVTNKKYQWFSGELQLNIVGVRNTAGQQSDGAGGIKHPLTNKFTDVVIVAWIENGQKFAESYPATTVPGASFALSTNRKFASQSKNPNGVGIMREKQFINQYTKGNHHGGSAKPHLALRSVSSQSAHRDKNYSDNWLTLAVTPVGKLGAAQAGLFSDGGGMQLHNSGASTAAGKTVDNWSAGCQVFANEKQHNRLMELVLKSEKKTKSSKFSYTLLNNKEIRL